MFQHPTDLYRLARDRHAALLAEASDLGLLHQAATGGPRRRALRAILGEALIAAGERLRG